LIVSVIQVIFDDGQIVYISSSRFFI